MGQKVHPTGFRLGIIKRHDSTWFADFKNYSRDLEEDYKIRRFFDKSNPNKFFNINTRKELEENYVLANITKIEIQRRHYCLNKATMFANTAIKTGSDSLEEVALLKNNESYYSINVIVHALQPEFILKIEPYLKRNFRNLLTSKYGDLACKKVLKPNICIKAIKVSNIQSVMIAKCLGEQLEKRIRYRRALRSSVDILKNCGIANFKLQVAGRLDGIAIARAEWKRSGRVPLHTIKADIDYACHRANTRHGIIGIKVWIFKGEVDHLAEARYWY
jgi:small subunit ribosomal protein S3